MNDQKFLHELVTHQIFYSRVAILSYRWNLRIKQHIKEAYGNHPAVKQDPQNTFFQICAFGLPAIQTVVTLITRQVDADELLGEKFHKI